MDDPFFVYCFDGLESVGHSFAYVAHFVFFRDVWIRTQRAAVASRPISARASIKLILWKKNFRTPETNI
jgi:hypothetical protein